MEARKSVCCCRNGGSRRRWSMVSLSADSGFNLEKLSTNPETAARACNSKILLQAEALGVLWEDEIRKNGGEPRGSPISFHKMCKNTAFGVAQKSPLCAGCAQVGRFGATFLLLQLQVTHRIGKAARRIALEMLSCSCYAGLPLTFAKTHCRVAVRREELACKSYSRDS